MRTFIVLACFFLSGVAGLVYEICWIRKASLVFGSTTFALSTVLAVFFGGLAIGSWLFGRVAMRRKRPLRIYAMLEIALGACAALSLPFFGLIDSLYGAVFASVSGHPVLLALLRVGLVSIVLLPPTILMGGTLPLFCRQFVLHRGSIAGRVGFLYGLNTAGAALGCAAAGFWLLPQIGVHASVVATALVNLVIGGTVLALRIPAPAHETPKAAIHPPTGPRVDRRAATIAALFFATGLIALGTEVLWSRFLALIVRNSVHTYTITLTVVLAGIVLGSLLASLVFDRRLPRALSFGVLQVLAALATLTLMLMPVAFWQDLHGGVVVYCALMLVPALLSGASFPLAMRMVVDDPALSAAVVGRMTAVNTVGGIVGSLVIGFVALPLLGMMTSLRLLTALGLSAGLAAWLLPTVRTRLWTRLMLAAVAVAAWVGVPLALDTRLPADFLAERDALVDYREGQTSSLAVIREDGNLTLQINRLWQGRDRKSHQIMAAHVPMLTHPAPRSICVIGVGTGQTPSRFLQYDIDRLDCVDIEPAIFPFIEKHYDAPWLHDARTRLISDDGRNWIAHGETKYDLISAEIGQIFRPGVEVFYTSEFYREAAARLNEGGLMAQFVPLALCTKDEFRGIVATFLKTFPEAMLWYNTAELLLIGRADGKLHLDSHRLAEMRTNTSVREDLQYSQWGGRAEWLADPLNYLGGFFCGAPELAAIAKGATIYRDDLPTLSYRSSEINISGPNEVPVVQMLREHLGSVDSIFNEILTGQQMERIDEMRQWNLRDIVAGASLRRADVLQAQLGPQRVLDELDTALRWNPRSAVANRMKATALVLAGRQAESETYFESALEIQPDEPLARRGLGMVLLMAGQRHDALIHLRKAVRLMPDDAASHNYFGVALAQQGQIGLAVEHLQKAADLRPDDPDIAANLQRALRDLVRAQQQTNRPRPGEADGGSPF